MSIKFICSFRLGLLMDGLVRTTMSKSNDDSIASSCILALSNVVKNASQHLSDSSRTIISELLNEAFHENHEGMYIVCSTDKDFLLILFVENRKLHNLSIPPLHLFRRQLFGAASSPSDGKIAYCGRKPEYADEPCYRQRVDPCSQGVS